MKRNLIELCCEKRMVEAKREAILAFTSSFGKFTCHIGGSYAMKCLIPDCLDIEPHDYDFIVRGDNLKELRACLERLRYLGVITKGSSDPNGSYRIGKMWGRPVDILLDSKYKSQGALYEDLEIILQVKKDWIAKYNEMNKTPRQKDIGDVALIEKYLEEGELPF